MKPAHLCSYGNCIRPATLRYKDREYCVHHVLGLTLLEHYTDAFSGQLAEPHTGGVLHCPTCAVERLDTSTPAGSA